jgi:hypothetical protein
MKVKARTLYFKLVDKKRYEFKLYLGGWFGTGTCSLESLGGRLVALNLSIGEAPVLDVTPLSLEGSRLSVRKLGVEILGVGRVHRSGVGTLEISGMMARERGILRTFFFWHRRGGLGGVGAAVHQISEHAGHPALRNDYVGHHLAEFLVRTHSQLEISGLNDLLTPELGEAGSEVQHLTDDELNGRSDEGAGGCAKAWCQSPLSEHGGEATAGEDEITLLGLVDVGTACGGDGTGAWCLEPCLKVATGLGGFVSCWHSNKSNGK